jgi:peptidoglycan biosynthesis protein MviN/MurJ (putative lipid II flippase)
MLIVATVSAAVGVVIAREFGRSDETDGLLSAYGVFIVIVIAAQGIRVAVLPQLARAWADRRLAGEIAGSALALAVFAAPLVLVTELEAQSLAGLLTGEESEIARDTAADALRWMVPAATAYLFAGLAASGLAARDEYGTAALGFAAGSLAGLTLILLRVESDGIIAIAWGMTLNASIALLVPAAVLGGHAFHARMPARAVRPTGPPLRVRLGTFVVGALLPLALQLLYVVCLPFAGSLGTGAATSFVYAYLAASSLVAVTAGSLGLVTSVPLSRSELSASSVSRHVVAATWVALTLIGGAAGVFALAGGDVVEAVLGRAYEGVVGAELGRLVVVLSFWMVAAVGVTVAFPLAFVSGRTRALPWIAVAALALQVPLAWAGGRLLELDGLALALAISNLLVLVMLLGTLHAWRPSARGLVSAGAVIGAIAIAAFSVPALILGSVPAALLGLAAYIGAFAVFRPSGLGESWRYLRALG